MRKHYPNIIFIPNKELEEKHPHGNQCSSDCICYENKVKVASVSNFLEMFTLVGPAIQGNEDLDPEKIRTYEVGLSYQFNKHVTSSINYFNNDIRDLIVLRTLSTTEGTTRYENFGDAHVQGIETETKIDITKGNYIFMNYTFQNPEDGNGDDMPFVAQHFGNFGVNVHYWKYINTNLSTFVSGSRSREADDNREDLPAYALLNLSVKGKEFFKTMEVQGTVFNLLDKDYSDPRTYFYTR